MTPMQHMHTTSYTLIKCYIVIWPRMSCNHKSCFHISQNWWSMLWATCAHCFYYSIICKKFLLQYSWFTMLCKFQCIEKLDQLYIYPLFLHSSQYRPLQNIEFPVLYSSSLLIIHLIYSNMYMSFTIWEYTNHW